MRLPEMVNPMNTRDLVAMFMESPFYFDLQVRERLALVQQHYRRFSINTKVGQCRLADEVSVGLTVVANANETITIIVDINSPNDATDS
jgi:tRNA G26 N,N-dimethylase Trm1